MKDCKLFSEMIETKRELLFKKFANLDIKAPTVPYPASNTVEEGKILRGKMKGIFIML